MENKNYYDMINNKNEAKSVNTFRILQCKHTVKCQGHASMSRAWMWMWMVPHMMDMRITTKLVFTPG